MLNKTTVAVASSSSARVHLYSLDKNTSPPTLTFTESLSMPFWPDNLHTSNGKLFIAGHAQLSGLTKFAESRAHCGEDTKSVGCDAVAPSYVVQWTREKGVEDVYVGTEIYSSSGVGMDEKRAVSVISGLYGKGLLVWGKEKK